MTTEEPVPTALVVEGGAIEVFWNALEPMLPEEVQQDAERLYYSVLGLLIRREILTMADVEPLEAMVSRHGLGRCWECLLRELALWLEAR